LTGALDDQDIVDGLTRRRRSAFSTISQPQGLLLSHARHNRGGARLRFFAFDIFFWNYVRCLCANSRCLALEPCIRQVSLKVCRPFWTHKKCRIALPSRINTSAKCQVVKQFDLLHYDCYFHGTASHPIASRNLPLLQIRHSFIVFAFHPVRAQPNTLKSLLPCYVPTTSVFTSLLPSQTPHMSWSTIIHNAGIPLISHPSEALVVGVGINFP
jgi:hypothetical protein